MLLHIQEILNCNYPELDKEESVLGSLFKEVLQTTILLRKFVGYVANVNCLIDEKRREEREAEREEGGEDREVGGTEREEHQCTVGNEIFDLKSQVKT